ncbi:MAG: iron-siderophore ABC transporter substrate-binding protein [Nostoc sp. DedQUE12b]|uniref:iron-siderophore ABC transporter substrate-binding protein n=1 Tax=Nostoc sp. DedQUE12b TaxID=3075398 RepID=UPI002AD32368|nr:iron-siderophore ABC transporter substrate-binding protein [Nostoc sp. DedQUE12b]MDZ8085073.1 iron-siderophore ABC transporter substrate-binding protein [Nostoc sp. DedQUE12b]
MGIVRGKSTAIVMLRRIVCLFLLGIFSLFIVASCSSNINQNVTNSKQLTENCRVVQHAMGETCIPQNPQRVVTLWGGTFSSALALGIKPIASAWIPGEPFPKHLGDKADGIENIGFEPNLERLLLLKPDLILSNTRLQNIYTQLTNIAPTVALDHPSPPASWQKTLEDIAKILDKEQESKQLINDYWQRIEQLKQALGVGVASPKENRRHQLQVSVATVDPRFGAVYTYGKKSPVGVVLDDIGLQRPSAQSGDFFTKNNISYERLSDIDGDVLFLSYAEKTGKKALEKLEQSPLWQKLKVVQQNRVYLVDYDHWYGFDVLAMNAVIDDLFKYLVNTP